MPAESSPPLLVLFDVDGTLVQGATEAHAESLHRALRLVHGVDSRKVRGTLSPSGRTDGELARLLLLDAGISAARIDQRRDAVREHCCQIYARLVPSDLSHTVLPGIRELLAELRGWPVRLGLVTGNYEPVARLKLNRARLSHAFAGAPGGFGSDSEDRAALPALARRRAGAGGVPHPRGRTVVIGDTPRDIACARADDVLCLAVATGPHAPDELSGADGVANDATELAGLLQPML